MLEGFSQLKKTLKDGKPPIISVAAAHDIEVIRAIKAADDEGLAKFVLFGDREKINTILREESISSPLIVENELNVESACRKAVRLIQSGEADMLMKGLVNSSVFLRSIIEENKTSGASSFLSHLAAFQILGWPKLLFFTDGGLNVFPDIDDKKKIIYNGIQALHSLGLSVPKVAVLTANEKIDDKIPATTDAAALSEMWARGLFPDCILEGPITMDVALSRDAATHKGIESNISGDTDLFIVPDIQSGNMIGKVLIYCSKAKMAGVVLGESYPIIMTSRAENAEGKLSSIALAAAIAKGGNNVTKY